MSSVSAAPATKIRFGVFALIACAVLWSLNGPFIKLLNEQGGGVPGITIACYRSLVGGVAFLPLALRQVGTLRCVAPAWPIASIIAFTVMTAAFVIANTMTAAANAIVLQYTSPIWVFCLSPVLLGERPAWREAFALLIAMAGVAILFFGSAGADLGGLLVALLAGCGYGVLTVILRGMRGVHPTLTMCINTLGSGLLLLPAVAMWGAFSLTPTQALIVALLGLVQFALPYVLFSWALHHVEAHRAALITLLEVILNPIWTWIAIREAPPGATLIGGPLILLGVIIWMLLGLRRRRL